MIYPSAGIGFLANVDDYATSAGVINTAQAALQKAKKTGLGRTHYFFGEESSPAPSAVNSLRLSAEMNSGLAAGEFIPYFQPIYSIIEGKIVGFETLAGGAPAQGAASARGFHACCRGQRPGKDRRPIMEGALKASGELGKQNPERGYSSPPTLCRLFQMPDMESVVASFLKTGAISLFVLR